MQTGRLFVGNLAWEVESEDLLRHFAEFKPSDAHIIMDKESGQSRGFGFVTIPAAMIRNAVQNKHKTILKGRDITVRPADAARGSAEGSGNNQRAAVAAAAGGGGQRNNNNDTKDGQPYFLGNEPLHHHHHLDAASEISGDDENTMLSAMEQLAIDDDMAGSCRGSAGNSIEFDLRPIAASNQPRVEHNALLFLREMTYIGCYSGEMIEFSCPLLVVEATHLSRVPAELLRDLARLRIPKARVRWTVECWGLPPKDQINLFNHPWVYPFVDMDKPRQQCDIAAGIYEPIHVDDVGCKKPLSPFGTLQHVRVSIHRKKGSMAMSPNNAQLRIALSSPSSSGPAAVTTTTSRSTPDDFASFWLLKCNPEEPKAHVSRMIICGNAAMQEQMRDAAQEGASNPRTLREYLASAGKKPRLARVMAALRSNLVE